MAEAGQELQDDGKRRPRVRAQAALDRALQVHAFQQLHGDERRPVVLAQLVHGDDVRMLQARDRARLAQEPLAVLRTRGLGPHHLEGDIAVEGFVASAEDDAHRAFAHTVEDAEAADLGGDVHGRAMIRSPASGMRAVVQRVSEASVTVDGQPVSAIGPGLLVLLGVGKEDAEADADYLADKIVNLRIFEDDAGQMNRSVLDMKGAILVVSQFTLYGDVRRGRRPGFSSAASPEEANRLYRYLVTRVAAAGLEVKEGIFRAMMDVRLVNHGPVTLLLDSTRAF